MNKNSNFVETQNLEDWIMEELKDRYDIKNYLVYHNDVYPFSLIVGKMSDVNQINKEYKGVDGKGISPHFHSDAATYPVYDIRFKKAHAL